MNSLYLLYRREILQTDLRGYCSIEVFAMILQTLGARFKNKGYGLLYSPEIPREKIRAQVKAYSDKGFLSALVYSMRARKIFENIKQRIDQ